MFIHLRTHSDYSLLSSMVKIEQLLSLVKQHKMPAVALTDSNNLFGALEFSESAVKNGVQPILGCDLNIKHNDSDTTILLLVRSKTGYKNLLHILYESSTKDISLDNLKGHAAGLIALTGGILSDCLLKTQSPFALIEQLISLFSDNLYIELQRFNYDHRKIEDKLIDIAYKNNLPLVATNKVLFANKDDYEAHDALKCIADGSYISDDSREKLTIEHYFKSQEEMQKLFADIPEAINNTVLIAQKCAFMVESTSPVLPDFPCKIDENEEIKQQAYDGLHARLNSNVIPQEYQARMEYELQVITT